MNLGVVRDRFYVRHQIVNLEENLTTEFKGHRSIAMDDVNPRHWNPNNVRNDGRTRQSWSKYIVGFLNSDCGGTLYGGILDNGSVSGISLSPHQMDHVQREVERCLSRYSPPCSIDRVKLQFVPVVEQGEEEEMAPLDPVVESVRFQKLEHRLGHPDYCWCDCEAMASFGRGLLLPWYVIELEVVGGLGEGRRKVYCKAEDGNIYIRKHGMTELYSESEIEEMEKLVEHCIHL